jgi:lipopolysaccharide heptosyltransferase I
VVAERFLIIRLGSLGDVVHTLPVAHALRGSFPRARIDWVIEPRWRLLLKGNPDLNNVVLFERASWKGIRACVRELRAARYTYAIDCQGLYKSALLAFFSRASFRVGFDRAHAREPGAAMFYNLPAVPKAGHIVEQNMSLAYNAGAKFTSAVFPLKIPLDASAHVEQVLSGRGIKEKDYYVMSPGGGWGGKCWPAERYGHLHRRLYEKYRWRGVVNYGPGERKLAEAVRLVAGEPEPLLVSLDIPQLMALLKRAKFVVAGDSGPLHLAAALTTPVVGLYGPTDPARNGPYTITDVVIRNAPPGEVSYKRTQEPAPSMLSITLDQVVAAIERRLGIA